MLNLKVGDKVFMTSTWRTEIGVVDKITPTGLIKVGGYTFRPDGRERVCDYDFCKYYENGRCGLDVVEICGGHCQDIDDERED